MKITEADLRRIIEEELKTIANSKHPSDVEMIEDPNVGGILVDPFEHIPEDVPAVVDKPQARVQHLVPIVRERRYSLRSLLAEDIRDDVGKLSVGDVSDDTYVSGLDVWASKNANIVEAWAKALSNVPKSTKGNRDMTHKILAAVLGMPNTKEMDLSTVFSFVEGWVPGEGRETGYDIDSLIAAMQNPSGLAVGGRDPEGTVEFDVEEINEARFVGGFGFGAPPSPTLSEVEDLDECGCDNPDMPSPHMHSAHDDHEGSMARSQLRQAAKYSQKLGHMINESDNLPEWVEAKITKASDYLSSVYEYIDNELNGK
jgi:hypothetical protein